MDQHRDWGGVATEQSGSTRPAATAAVGSPPAWPRALAALPRRARAVVGRIVPPRRRAVTLITTLTLAGLLLGLFGSLGVLEALDAQATARDATRHANALQQLLTTGDLLEIDRLKAAQAHLRALSDDVQRLRRNSLVNSGAALGGAGGLIHALAMADHFTAAGNAGIDAALILLPHAGDLFHDLSGNATRVQPASLTPADLRAASANVELAAREAKLALSERAYVHDADLQRFGLGSLIPRLRQLDAAAPKLSADLDAARALVAALPSLLGMSTPARYLLLNLDSDELRPTGGFPGNYAIVTLSGARLQGGIQLHDVYTLDCPRGCPYRPIPAEFAWMDVAPTYFGLRDANLDPDYPASSRLLEQLLQDEGGPKVDGVVSITPGLIKRILEITGSVTVAEYNRSVSSTDFQEVIHYYHLAGNHAIPGKPYGTSDRKVFDSILGTQLLHTVGTLPAERQRAVLRAALDAMATRDLQVYLNDTAAEGALAALGASGAVDTPDGGDSLLVVDANTGVSYANADIAERIADVVALDAQGAATHETTITYTYTKRTHLYDAVYVAAGGGWYYRDFARVIVPAGAQLISGQGCAWQPVAQAQHQAWGCSFQMSAGQTRALTIRWSVPKVTKPQAGGSRYEYIVQRQAGSLSTADITIRLPAGARAIPPLSPPLVASADGAIGFSAPLARSQHLTLSYTT